MDTQEAPTCFLCSFFLFSRSLASLSLLTWPSAAVSFTSVSFFGRGDGCGFSGVSGSAAGLTSGSTSGSTSGCISEGAPVLNLASASASSGLPTRSSSVGPFSNPEIERSTIQRIAQV